MRNNSSDFKPIYIHWYEDDFQADLAVRRMTSRQRAFYRNLLMYAYFGDKRPYLTAADAELWLIADADTQQEWLDNKKPILAKFTERMTKDGPRLVNKRVLEEWQIIEDYLAQRKKAGLASAAARRRENGHSDPEIPALIVHPATTVERPLTTVEHPSTDCQQAASSLPTDEDDLAEPIHWGLMPEFERRVRMLEREYIRHLNALVQEFRSRSRVLERKGTKKNSERSRQAKKRWLKKMGERNA